MRGEKHMKQFPEIIKEFPEINKRKIIFALSGLIGVILLIVLLVNIFKVPDKELFTGVWVEVGTKNAKDCVMTFYEDGRFTEVYNANQTGNNFLVLDYAGTYNVSESDNILTLNYNIGGSSVYSYSITRDHLTLDDGDMFGYKHNYEKQK